MEEFVSMKPIGYGRYSISRSGVVRTDDSGRLRTTSSNCHEYDKIGLTSDSGSRKDEFVHVLLALIFVGPRPGPKHTVDHINRDKKDNRVENLRWATASEQNLNKPKSVKKGTPITQMYNGVDFVTWLTVKFASKESGWSQTKIYSELSESKSTSWKYALDDIEGELWKCTEDIYLYKVYVSNMGRVHFQNRKTFGGNKEGYKLVYLTLKNGDQTNERVHRLVCNAFFGPKDMHVNHIDGNRSNNKLTNLEYVTQKDNVRHAIQTGLRVFEKNNKNSKSVQQLDLKGNLIKTFPSLAEAERQTGNGAANISRACRSSERTCGGYKWKFEI